jgi:hypothetical protein
MKKVVSYERDADVERDRQSDREIYVESLCTAVRRSLLV